MKFSKFSVACLSAGALMAIAGPSWSAQEWSVATDYAPLSAGVTVTAVANTGGTDNSTNYANNGALQTIQVATWVNSYGGIYNADGCTTAGTFCDLNDIAVNQPEHAIDNDERYDMALLSFTGLKKKITDVKIRWSQNDSDISVLAYTGTGDPTANGNLFNKKYDQLVGSGWTIIGNYANAVVGANTAINGLGVFSSYWLIGAYNPLAAGNAGFDPALYDYVKLGAVTGCTSGEANCGQAPGTVPEPGSLALFGAALVGMVSLRRRQQRS